MSIYFICAHPLELMLYRGFAAFFREWFPRHDQYTILIEHPYFSRYNYKRFLDSFNNVYFLPFCKYSKNPLRGLADVQSLRKAINSIPLEEKSLFLIGTVTKTELSVNLLLRRIRRKTHQVSVLTLGTYFRTVEARTNHWKAWLLHNFYCSAGSYPVKVMYKDGRLIEREYYRENSLIDYQLVLSHRWTRNPIYAEIKCPLVAQEQHAGRNQSYVIFLGDATIPDCFPEIPRDRFISLTNEILRRIAKMYQDDGTLLYYKAHPIEIGREVPFDLTGFELYEEPYTAEMLYTILGQSIRAVYTVASTSARTADIFGIRAHVFFEMFGFEGETKELWRNYLLVNSKVTSIRDFAQLQPAPTKGPGVGWTSDDNKRLSDLFLQFGL